jgi:hypothetical protein
VVFSHGSFILGRERLYQPPKLAGEVEIKMVLSNPSEASKSACALYEYLITEQVVTRAGHSILFSLFDIRYSDTSIPVFDIDTAILF